MVHSANYLLVGSIEAYSGKSGTILGLAHQLREKGLSLAYSKPIGTCIDTETSETDDADIEFIGQALGLKNSHLRSPLIPLTEQSLEKRLAGEDSTDYPQKLQQSLSDIDADVVIIEGAGNLWEGALFGLSIPDMAKSLNAPILLVARYHSSLIVDSLLKAKLGLGDRLAGVVINDIPSDALEKTKAFLKPYLESQGIAVFGLLPASRLLRSVSVREIAHQLKAQVLCRQDRLDLMVESLTIGAMNVNSALEYFRQGQNKAVVTGGDRTDLQLAALETSTSCLILTGHMAPQPLIINRAEDLEIPLLSVDLDTLSTVEIVDRAFGTVRIQENIKVNCIQELMTDLFDVDRLIQSLGL